VASGGFIAAKLRDLANFALVKTLLPCAFFFLSLLLSGCDRPEMAVPPAELLSKEQMRGVLIDLHLLEARIESGRLSTDSARALYNEQQRLILQQHQVTDSVFRQSYRYYAIHDKDMDIIYAQIIDSLTAREKKLEEKAAPK